MEKKLLRRHRTLLSHALGDRSMFDVAEREAEAVLAFKRAVFLDPRNEYATMNLFTARALYGSDCFGPQ